MTSEDRIIIELINSRFDAMDKRFEMIEGRLVSLEKKTDELKAEVAEVKNDVRLNTVKIEELHYFFGLSFTIMAAVIALVGFGLALAPMFREMYRDRREERMKSKNYVTRSEMEDAITRALRMK